MSIKKIAVDDNIIMKTKVSSAGSKMLQDFKPPFNATIISKLEESGVSDIIKTKPNEFGIDLMSSFGCIEAVASGEAEIGIGCDSLGTIRAHASKNNLCFIKPTYGTVSRYGLVSMVPSMEQIGIACKDISKGFEILSIIAGADEKDGTLADIEKYDFMSEEAGRTKTIDISDSQTADELKGVNIGVPTCCADFDEVKNSIKALTSLGADVSAFDFPLLEYAASTSYIIAAAEMSNSISRFDGIKFGYRTENFSNLEDIYINSRTEGFAFETKFLTLLGVHVLSKGNYDEYFDQAQKVRRLIKDATNDIFEKYDVILTSTGQVNTFGDCDSKPSANAASGTFERFANAYKDLKYLALPNLIAAPAISLPGNIQIIAKEFNENMLYRVCNWRKK